MNLRSSCVLLSACLALTACDTPSDDSTSGSNSTSGGSTSDDDPTNISVSVSISATTPPTDPATTDSTVGDTDASSTDATDATSSPTEPTAGETDSTTTDPTEGGTDSTTTGGAGGTSVYDVQDGTVAEGETVTIEGVVITGLRSFVGVTVQEIDGGEYSGVYVDTGDVDLSTFAVGDIVDLTGVTAESNPGSTGLDGLTQILIDADGSMTATGDTMELSVEAVDFTVLADPDTAEPWESVLVTTSGAFEAVTATASFGEFGEFAVEEGGATLTVDNFLYAIFDKDNAADFPGFGEGATFTAVSGVLNYSFGTFKLAPRSAAELEGYAAPAG
ncbi:MAG: hypothetical protein ACRBN8_25860 [Nannocystales bacterium]